MSTNLVASVAKLLTPDLLSRLSSVLGIDQSTIEKAVSAGVPGIFAALVSLVSKPGGAAKISDVVRQQPPGSLSEIASAGAAAQRNIMDTGMSSLSSLLGGSTMSALSNAIGKYAGMGEAGSKSVLGVLAPAVLGVLGQQQRASGLDASGLAQLLQSQAGNISRALPSGFARQLSDAGVMDRVTTSTGRSSMREESSSHMGWVLPALALVALGALAWYLFGRPHDQTVANAPTAGMETPMQTQAGRDVIITAEQVKNWIGRPVFSSDNQKVGEIIDIRRGPDNKITDIYFDAGSFLGAGAKRYHITSNQIEEIKPDGVTVTLKETEVKALPETADKMGQ